MVLLVEFLDMFFHGIYLLALLGHVENGVASYKLSYTVLMTIGTKP